MREFTRFSLFTFAISSVIIYAKSGVYMVMYTSLSGTIYHYTGGIIRYITMSDKHRTMRQLSAPIIMLAMGLCLLLYPQISSLISHRHATQDIAEYSDDLSQLDEARYVAMWSAAVEFNQALAAYTDEPSPSDEQREHYDELLNVTEGGAMGYIEIPAIDVRLPIYHGTDEEVLQTAVGHIEWSSLPVGGESTHCVLSGHSGLPSATLFTHLDKLVVGDSFSLYVLGNTLNYQVDQVLVVQPDDISALQIIDGQDLCTLVTCTPYGINTERLLVRGHRVDEARQD